MLFVCVLRPVLGRGLPFRASKDLTGFARELAGLNWPSFLKIRLL